MPKNAETTAIQLCLFHMLPLLCSKSFKLGFSSTWTENFQIFKLDLEKPEEPEIKLPTYVGSLKKQKSSRKIYFCFIDYAEVFVCVDHNKLWKILQEMGIPDHLTCRLRNLYAGQETTVRTGHGTWTSSKLGKAYVKAVYCHPAYLTFMQSTSWKCQAGWSTSWIKTAGRNINNPQICKWQHPYSRKQRGTKEPPDEGLRGEWKSWLKTQHLKN